MLKERAAGERRAAGTCPKFSRDKGLSDLPLCADASHASLLPIRPGEREIAEKYRLERLLGRGGMGAVYQARRTGLDRAVAVKLLRHDYLEDSQVLERFRREARTVARIRHPNVADNHDYGVLPTDEA